MKRTLARGSLLLAAAALATSGLIASPAGAATAQQTCKKITGTANAHARPRRRRRRSRPQPRRRTVTGCAPAKKTGGTGKLKAKLNLPANSSCQGLATGSQTIKIPSANLTWKNHKTSTMALDRQDRYRRERPTVATITGKVTKGLFKGHKVTTALSFTPKSGENCTPGHPIKHLTLKNAKPFVIH